MNFTKHAIVIGDYFDGNLRKKKESGYAFMNENDSFYTVKIHMNPINNYFLVKNKKNDLYTVFSKIDRSNNQVNFKNPVGYAKLLENNKSYMQIKFFMPKMTMFMDLYAS